jgi:RNA recognition motif-containing protein
VRVSNVPLTTKKKDLEEKFLDFGQVKRVWILPGKEGSETTLGFVTYAKASDASEVAKLTDLKIDEKVLKFKIAPNTKYRGDNLFKPKGDAVEVKDKKPIRQFIKTENTMRTNPRKARLIVRNLAFKATDENTKEYFEQFGELSEVNILRKPDGKLVGCAFLQYKNTNHAVKAIKEANAKPFLGRPVAIDWAVPKEVYKEAEVKKEEVEIKDEPLDEGESTQLDSSVEVKEEDEEEDGENPFDEDEEEDDDEDDPDLHIEKSQWFYLEESSFMSTQWKKRWFILREVTGTLEWYATNRMKELLGMVYLDNVMTEEKEDKSKLYKRGKGSTQKMVKYICMAVNSSGSASADKLGKKNKNNPEMMTGKTIYISGDKRYEIRAWMDAIARVGKKGDQGEKKRKTVNNEKNRKKEKSRRT